MPCVWKEHILFVKNPTLILPKRFSETGIIKMLEFLIESIHVLVMLSGSVFQQTVGILTGTNCAPLFTDLFLYSYVEDFIQGFLKKNFTFRYIDVVLSFNNSKFDDFVNRIYAIELEMKDTTDTARSASYLDLHPKIDSEGLLRMKFNDNKK
jgi:hypothetical protein